MTWEKYLFGKKEEIEKLIPSDSELDSPPIDRLFAKNSRGKIDDAWGVTAGSDYVEKYLDIRGATDEDIWIKYQFNSWVRACVDKIIKEVSKYELKVAPKDISKANDPLVKKRLSEVQSLLDNPNSKVESFIDIRKKYLRDVLIYDSGAVEIVYNSAGKPAELYDLKGCNIRLDVDKHGNFKDPTRKAYKLVSSSSIKSIADFGIKELIYFMANPISGSVYGLSPIETLWDEIENDNAAAVFNKKILRHSGLITGVLSFAGMNDRILRRQRSFWEQEVHAKGQKLILTNNKDIKFVRVSDKQTDMQFMEYQKWLLLKIMAVYGMQPIVLGVIDPTTGKLNSSEQREQFKQDAILPLLELEKYRWTDVLLRQGFGFDDLELVWIEPSSVDESFDLEKVKVGCQFGFITINEARSWVNLLPLEGDKGKGLINSESVKYLQDLISKDQSDSGLEDLRGEIEEFLSE